MENRDIILLFIIYYYYQLNSVYYSKTNVKLTYSYYTEYKLNTYTMPSFTATTVLLTQLSLKNAFKKYW